MIYAQISPDQPTIPSYSKFQRNNVQLAYQDQLQDSLSQATRVVTKRSQIKQFRPRIIKSNRASFRNSFQALEHQRQVNSMKKRIENCKNIQQRKKDRNDPIVYPPYFVRRNEQSPDVRLDSYTQKVMNNTTWRQRQKKMNRIYDKQKITTAVIQPTRNNSVRKYHYNMEVRQDQNSGFQYNQENPQLESQLPSPVFYKKEMHTLKAVQSSPADIKKRQHLNLPQNDIRSILDFVYNRLIYKQEDLQALKSRMMHAYGKQAVKNTWKLSMRLLQRDI